MANNRNGTGPLIDPGWNLAYEAASRVGVPFAILLIFLSQLSPKIDRGLEIADHVDAELQYLASVGCSPALPTTIPRPR